MIDIYKIIGLFVIVVGVFTIYVENAQVDPVKEDRKIIKSFNSACLVEEQLALAEIKKKECASKFDTLSGTELIEACNIYAYDVALIDTNKGKIYNSFINSYLEDKQKGSMPLSTGEVYKGTCPKFNWIDADKKDLDKVLEKSLEKSS